MELSLPPAMDRLPRHRERLEAACRVGMAEADVLGMTIAGSFADGEPDPYSDLDLRVVVEDDAVERRLAAAPAFAAAAGPLVAAFTGEHVGEPRLLICLYADLVHVDYLTIALGDLAGNEQGRPSRVLWERDGRVSAALPGEPPPDDLAERLAWLEARMWTWSWYIQSKILRGELYEALDGIQYLRQVLFRVLSVHRGVPFAGGRRAERLVGERAAAFARTVPALDAGSLMDALRAVMGLYVELADPLLAAHGLDRNEAARLVIREALEAGPGWRAPEEEG